MSNVTAKREKQVDTPPTQQEIDQAIEALVIARVSMLFQQPFFGNVATRLKLTDASGWLPTAATDSRKFYFNAKFINKLKPKERVFLVGHELFHAIFDHCGTFSRLETRNAQVWNIAADYAVNSSLIENRVGEMITTVPCLYEPKYKGWATEEIYDDLMKNAKPMTLDQLAEKLLDQHLDGDGEDGEGSGADKLSAEERQSIKDELKEAMLSAAQAVGIGNVPGNMKRFIDGLVEPKMDWRQVLQQEIESQVKNDFTYMKPSRRGWGCDAIMPSMKREPTVEVFLALDMSGSIGKEEITAFFSEVKGMVDQFASFNISVICWDTCTYNYQVFTEDTVDDLMSYEPQGGGGTDPNCVFRFLEENELQPKQLVFFTDLEIGNFGPEDQVENVIWLVKNKYKTDAVAPFGLTLQYE